MLVIKLHAPRVRIAGNDNCQAKEVIVREVLATYNGEDVGHRRGAQSGGWIAL